MVSTGVCMMREATTTIGGRNTRKRLLPTMTSPAATTTMTTSSSSKFTSEILSGSLTMLGGASDSSSLRVCVKVYRTSLEHFAVVYPDKVSAKPIGYVNLKNCSVECSSSNSGNGSSRVFHVIRKSCDHNVLTFRTESPCDVRRWAEALHDESACKWIAATAPATSPRRKSDDCLIKASLPIVVEEGDEE